MVGWGNIAAKNNKRLVKTRHIKLLVNKKQKQLAQQMIAPKAMIAASASKYGGVFIC